MKPPKKSHRHRSQSARPIAVRPTVETSQVVQIEKPIYGGAFLARAEGKAVFVPLTLPGEQARVRITQSKRGYDTADPDEILSAAPERIAPPCPHFGSCGGCNYQHANYASQLAFKQTILRETLQRGGVTPPAEIKVLAANPWQYRNRVRLAFDASGKIGYRGRRSNAIVAISECPIAAPLILRAAKVFADVSSKFGPEFKPIEITLFCDAEETAVLALVGVAGSGHPGLPKSKSWFDDFAGSLHAAVPALQGVELVAEGSAAQPARTLAQWGAPSLRYRAAGFDYRVDHGAFFQVNRFLVDDLVNQVTAGYKGKLAWDLFSGVGLFARRLTASFDSVVAAESAPTATQALAANLKDTCGTPVRSTTLDFLRTFKPNCHASSIPDLVVVDPPRTGLGPEITESLARLRAPAMVYVSCDPATLARDLRPLISSGYAIASLTLADMFPQTFHLETLVHLHRA
jgi:23S rRNA (uracil1939-C5)-methyltransferase